jgi:cytochrome c peroxidase
MSFSLVCQKKSHKGLKMTKLKSVLVLASGLVFCSYSAWAESPSVELGEKLFNDPGLGASKNATSCGTCHPQGKGMEKAGANPQLTAMINRCVQGPLKGDEINEKTVTMESLKMYIKSLAK